MVELELVRKWGKEKYPWLLNNEDFLIKLYKKEVLNETVIERRKVFPQFVMIKELKEGVPASLRVKMIEQGRRTPFQVCRTCGRKTCLDKTHGGFITKYAVTVELADEEDTIKGALFFAEEETKKIENSYEFIVYGIKTKDSRTGEPTFRISGWEGLSEKEGEAFNKLYDFFSTHLNGDKSIRREEYLSWLNNLNNELLQTNIKEMEKFLIVKEDTDKLTVNIG